MRFSRYPKYKESGVPWLGAVPTHWDVWALKRLVSLKSGDSITADEISSDGEYPVMGGNGLRGFTSGFTHDGEFALIGRQGALCGNVNYASGKFWASEHALVVAPKVPLATLWVGEMLRAMNLNQYSVSAAQPGLSVEVLDTLRTTVPPLREQQQIAAFLAAESAKFDSLIIAQERLIALLKEKRQALVSAAVKEGLATNVRTVRSGIEWLGKVPTHWKIARLATLFREVANAGRDDLPVLTVSIHDGVSDREYDEAEMDRKVTRSEDRTKYKHVLPGDLVYNMMRAWQGGFGTVAVEGMVSPAYVVARPKTELPTRFIEHLLRTPQAIEEMRRYSRGVTDFRLRLYWDEFKNIRVAVPPSEEARAICDHIAECDQQFSTLAAQASASIELLRERRTALISAAVTGKIDVRAAVSSEVA